MKRHERLAKKREKRWDREIYKESRRELPHWRREPESIVMIFCPSNIDLVKQELGECVLDRQGTHSKPNPEF